MEEANPALSAPDQLSQQTVSCLPVPDLKGSALQQFNHCIDTGLNNSQSIFSAEIQSSHL